jgi:hypothetical protein
MASRLSSTTSKPETKLLTNGLGTSAPSRMIMTSTMDPTILKTPIGQPERQEGSSPLALTSRSKLYRNSRFRMGLTRREQLYE